MAVTLQALAKYLGADPVRDADELARVSAVANALVDRLVSQAWREVPQAISDEAFYRTAYSVYKMGGTTESGSFLAADGQPAPGVAMDPLHKSWNLLKPYVDRV